jgi:type IV fimbrial biogenesis protein FimT
MLGTHTSSRPARVSGFTLVELMVTVFVAGILLAVAVPSFNRMMVTSRVTAQANEFVAAINFARSEAIKRNTSMTLCRANGPNATACTGQAGNWQHWIVRPVAPANAAVVRRGLVNEFSQALVVRSTLTGDQVVFGGDGLARSGGAVIADEQIHVCSTGRVDPDSRRRVVFGAASRLFTESFQGDC